MKHTLTKLLVKTSAMIDTNKIAVEILEAAKLAIQQNMESEGINASGKTSASLEVYEHGDIVGLANSNSNPFETTEEGREPGNVPRNFTEIIYQWHIDKGLNWGDEKEAKKIAGAVAWGKIQRFGYGRPSSSHFGSVKKEIYTPEIEKVKLKIERELQLQIIKLLK